MSSLELLLTVLIFILMRKAFWVRYLEIEVTVLKLQRATVIVPMVVQTTTKKKNIKIVSSSDETYNNNNKKSTEERAQQGDRMIHTVATDPLTLE